MSMPKGSRNAWLCTKCGGYTVAVHVDEGTTPMFLKCRATPGCDGKAESLMYPKQPWPDKDTHGKPVPHEPSWEFYKPDDEETSHQPEEVKDHIARGGLLIRPIATVASVAEQEMKKGPTL